MKEILLACLFTTLFFNAVAQDGPPRKKFGVRLGGNYSLMNFNKGFPRPSSTVTNTWKPGFDARFQLHLHFNSRLSLQPEYAFVQMNGEDERINTTYELNYLSLPILLKVKLIDRVSLLAGPQFDLLISSKDKTNGVKTKITNNTEERNISAVFGLEATIYKGIFIDARYLAGFNHVGLRQQSTLTEFKWQGFAIGIGTRF